MPDDLLVVGGSGFLGREIVRQARLAGDRVAATFHNHPVPVAGVGWHTLDIRCRADVVATVDRIRPAVIINAAYRQSDWATTADGGMHVAAAAAAIGARLVHVSSDAVFSGTAVRYHETCHPDPTTAYGAAKATAETAVKGLDRNAIIARISLIIGDGGSPHEVTAGKVYGVDPNLRAQPDAVASPIQGMRTRRLVPGRRPLARPVS